MGIFGRITCCLQDVNLSAVLRSGQSFRWVKLASEEWVGPLGRHLWILRQDESGIDFRVLPAAGSKSEMHQDKVKAFIEDYFQLSVSLPDLYKTWSEADEAFGVVGDKLPGVRMLRQDPVENLFCFICSSNNNIQRITSMVEKLCARFGEPIAEYDGRAFHAFPSVSALAADGVESELRQLGFGYRARFIGQTAGQVAERGGERWLDGLRLVGYPECHAELRRLFGVGAKVADCVCLMSLDQAAAVPVDTHVHQLAARHYLPELRHVKTLTDRTYRQVADHFRTVFGDRAGWAQAVLFCGDLNEFKKPLGAPVTPKKSTVKSAKTDKKSAKTDKKSAKIDKKSAKTDKKSAKTDKKSAKTDKKSARTDKKSAAKSDAESVTSLSELVPAKRKRTAVVATESTPRTTESTPGTPKGDASVRSCATERNKRRSKRQQNSGTVTVN